jgi:hypothetical protein
VPSYTYVLNDTKRIFPKNVIDRLSLNLEISLGYFHYGPFADKSYRFWSDRNGKLNRIVQSGRIVKYRNDRINAAFKNSKNLKNFIKTIFISSDLMEISLKNYLPLIQSNLITDSQRVAFKDAFISEVVQQKNSAECFLSLIPSNLFSNELKVTFLSGIVEKCRNHEIVLKAALFLTVGDSLFLNMAISKVIESFPVLLVDTLLTNHANDFQYDKLPTDLYHSLGESALCTNKPDFPSSKPEPYEQSTDYNCGPFFKSNIHQSDWQKPIFLPSPMIFNNHNPDGSIGSQYTSNGIPGHYAKTRIHSTFYIGAWILHKISGLDFGCDHEKWRQWASIKIPSNGDPSSTEQ